MKPVGINSSQLLYFRLECTSEAVTPSPATVMFTFPAMKQPLPLEQLGLSPGRVSAVESAAASVAFAPEAAVPSSGLDEDLWLMHCPVPLLSMNLAAKADGSIWLKNNNIKKELYSICKQQKVSLGVLNYKVQHQTSTDFEDVKFYRKNIFPNINAMKYIP